MKSRLLGLTTIAAFAAIYLIWGSTYLAIRYAIETIPPLLMAGARLLLAGVPLMILSTLRRERRAGKREWGHAALTGGLLFLGGHGALSWSEQFVPSGLAALILTTIPLWMAILDAARPGGAPLDRRTISGLGVGILGVGVLIGPANILGGAPVDAIGATVLLFGALSWSGGSVLARGVASAVPALRTAAMRLLSGGILLWIAGLLSGEANRFVWSAVSFQSLIALAYLVVFGSILSFTAYTWLLGVTTPARIGTYAYVNPLVAVLLGWGIGGEALNLRVLVSGLLVLTAVALVLGRSRARPRHGSAPGAARSTINDRTSG